MSADDKTIALVASVLGQHELGESTGGTAAGAWVQCSCGIPIAGYSRWHVWAEALKHVARALADEGLITPATLRKEYGEGPLEDGEPSHWPIPVPDCVACEDAAPDHFRWVTDWFSSTNEKEQHIMSDVDKPTTVKVVIPGEQPEIGGTIGQAIIIEADEFWSNSDRELIISKDGTDVAQFAAGQWRYAQLLLGTKERES